jgi:dihydroorotase
VLSHNPAQIGRLYEQGQEIAAGSVANLTLIDPTAKRVIDATHSKSDNNPYRGLTLPGAVVHTIYRGYQTVANGQLAETGRA